MITLLLSLALCLDPNNPLPSPIDYVIEQTDTSWFTPDAGHVTPTVQAVCQHWLAGSDCNIPSGAGDWNGDKIVDLRDFALAAAGDTDRLVIWGVTECDMWEQNAVVNRERQCK